MLRPHLSTPLTIKELSAPLTGRAGLYVRLSPKRGEDRTASRDYWTAIAEQNAVSWGLTVAGRVFEEAPAKRRSRPGLEGLIAAGARGELDVVMLSRGFDLTTSGALAGVLHDKVAAAGLRLMCFPRTVVLKGRLQAEEWHVGLPDGEGYSAHTFDRMVLLHAIADINAFYGRDDEGRLRRRP